jgi:hypothetical protein|tara:strand:+ start:45 stop:293 length:249 start_codon:yes stop_codon:yes gene_type:complete
MAQSKVTHTGLKELLQTGIVKFFFQKRDGELREAYGTTKLSEIPFDKRPKGTGRRPSGITPFFCIQNQEWRSVSEVSEVWKG